MPSPNLQRALELGLQHHQAGQLAQAESLYRQVLAGEPNQPDALRLLGLILCQAGDYFTAVELIERATKLVPASADYHNSLGAVLEKKGDLKPAEQSFRAALSLNPQSADALNNLGNVLRAQDRPVEAIDAYRVAIKLSPTIAHTHYNLAIALKGLGRRDEAVAAFREAIRLRPELADAHNNLGNLLRECGDSDGAVAALQTAIQLRPGFTEALTNLAVALMAAGRLAEAGAVFEAAAQSDPGSAPLQHNLAFHLQSSGKLDEALAAFRRAVESNPNSAEAFNYLGQVLRDRGELDEAIACFRSAVSLKPDVPSLHSTLIFTLNYHPAYSGADILAEARVWARRHAEPLHQFILPHTNSRDAQRRLHIGYVSADMHQHPVARQLLLLLRNHDREQFHVTCYSNDVQSDSMQEALRGASDQWRNIAHVADELVAGQIRNDGIDVLVDLSLHTSGNRLPVFARKPAPVQMTFGGYPGTTGLSDIAYRITDHHLDPPGLHDQFYSERCIRLPGSFWCFEPDGVGDEQVNEPPVARSQHITFGCLNNFWKINRNVLNLWARVLRAVEGSRLLILTDPGGHRERTVAMLEQAGVEPQRIEFANRCTRAEYMQLYNRVDISLDTFPYNGHTTSLDSLWMGVPVVSLVGQTAVARGGLSLLSNFGLQEFAVSTEDAYAQAASALANDLRRLADVRATLRRRMLDSPLTDATAFTRNFENACRAAWTDWVNACPQHG